MCMYIYVHLRRMHALSLLRRTCIIFLYSQNMYNKLILEAAENSITWTLVGILTHTGIPASLETPMHTHIHTYRLTYACCSWSHESPAADVTDLPHKQWTASTCKLLHIAKGRQPTAMCVYVQYAWQDTHEFIHTGKDSVTQGHKVSQCIRDVN